MAQVSCNDTGRRCRPPPLLLSFALPLAAHGGVIPAPAKVKPGSGLFRVDATVVLRVAPGDRDAEAAAHYLADLWTRTNA